MFQTLSSKFHQMIVLFAILVCAMPAMAAFFNGEGTETSPYEIANEIDLQHLAKDVNGGTTYEGIFFILTDDIDLSSVCGLRDGGDDVNWTPIGNYSYQFKGNFNGNGHTISNLYINAPDSSYQGLFGVLDNGSIISNLGVINGSVSGKNYVGGVCGLNDGTISTSYNSGSVSGDTDVGGVCGANIYGIMINSYNIGNVSGLGIVGGVCGENYGGTISNSYNSGSVSGIDDYVGGVCGANGNGIISTSYNSGSVSGIDKVGGVCGSNSYGTIGTSYYDKQMCTIGGINDRDLSGSAEGKLTSEMTGSQIFSDTTIWVTADNMYPRLKGMETTDVAIVAATPIFLTNEEIVYFIYSAFTLGTGNGVAWSNKKNYVSISSGAANIVQEGNDTLVCTLGNATKRIGIHIGEPMGIVSAKTFNAASRLSMESNGFYMDFGNENHKIAVYGVHGKKFAEYEIHGKSFVNMSRYGSGLYIVKADNGLIWNIVKK